MVAIKNQSTFNVPISGPDGHVHHTLPGDVFPEWAEVTNPLVVGDQLVDDETREARYREDLAKLQAQYGIDESKSEDAGDDAGAGDDSGSESGKSASGVPPRKGPGSGVDAWADYALDKEVEIEQGMSRDEIIAACEKAGVPA